MPFRLSRTFGHTSIMTKRQLSITALMSTPKKPKTASSGRSAPSSSSPLTTEISADVTNNHHSSNNDYDANIDPLRRPHPGSAVAAEYGIIDRRFYPHEMSDERVAAYNTGELPRPYDRLRQLMYEREQQQKARESEFPPGNSVLMWFRNDLRLRDNRALSLASQLARQMKVPLLACFVVSPGDYRAHLRSSARIDFLYRHLQILRDDLDKLNIPLHVFTVDDRRLVPERVCALAAELQANHVFANIELEVDELRRDIKVLEMLHARRAIFRPIHDTCVVTPGALSNGQGKQYEVFTPWFKSWIKYVNSHPETLEQAESPHDNHPSVRTQYVHLFGSAIPELPLHGSEDNDDPLQRWTSERRERMRSLWPAGESAAFARLAIFCNESKIANYVEQGKLPGETAGTSSLSPYLAIGSISARTCVRMAKDHERVSSSAVGAAAWIRGVAWRDFYRHILARWPHVCMNKPFRYKAANIQWNYNNERFLAWCRGRTGYPIVDAAMRQLRDIGWMHNRCRMIVASFLTKDLHLDWRLGEQFFMKSLIDGDLSNNNAGWGFGASVGVDPMPYFRIFNPLLQSEKFDPEGTYIRRWVPELRSIKGNAIHDPYGRDMAIVATRVGYPRRIVVHESAKAKALSMYQGQLKN